MSRVAHYLPRWLELSAGFVAAQLKWSRHDNVVLSRDEFVCLDAFPYQPRRSLHVNKVPGRTPRLAREWIRRVQLATLLPAYRADLVHVHFGHQVNDVVGTIGRRPYVLSLHGHDITGLLHDQPHHYDRVVGTVHEVIVPSRFLAAATERAGFDPSLIRIIPSGIDTKFFAPTPLPGGPPTIAYVGRLVEKKGLDVLLEAWPLVHAEHPQSRLVVLGDGPLAPLLREADESVTHVLPEPARRHEQVRDVIRSARLVVTPSRTAANGDSESLLLVNLEAAASGRPVVSTDHGGIPEFVHDGETGLLVAEGDAVALAGSISRVLGDASLAKRLADSAVRHAATLDVRACAARVDDLYDEVRRNR